MSDEPINAVELEKHGEFILIAEEGPDGNYSKTTLIHPLYNGSDYTSGTENGVDSSNYHFVNGSSSCAASAGTSSGSSSSSSASSSFSGASAGGGGGIKISGKTLLKIAAFFVSVTVFSNIATAVTAFFHLGISGIPGIVMILLSIVWIIFALKMSKKKYWHKKRWLLQVPPACILLLFGVYLLLCSLGVFDINAFLNILSSVQQSPRELNG